ncbi:MAG: DUF3857 domain-containing protein [Saprospiraceae bacterium]
MKNIFLFLLCLLVVKTTTAQSKNKVKFGKIDKDDLEMTTYKLDEEAEAVMLEKHVSIQYEIRGDDDVMVYDYHIRIKVLDKAGLDYANIEIPYYSYKGQEKIGSIKAVTYNLENGKVKKTKVKGKNIFTEDVAEKVSTKKFTFPNVQVGSIIEYRYSLKSKSIIQLEDFYFQEDIPVRRSSYKVKVPNFFNYITIKQVTRPFDVETSKHININMGTEIGNIKGVVYLFEMHNVPALKEETFITTMDDYRQRIRVQLKSYDPPNGATKEFFSTWEDTKKRMMKDEDFGGIFTKTRTIKFVLEEFLSSHDVDEMSSSTKAKAVFHFVQKNVKWNGNYGIYSIRKPKEVLKSHSGSVGEKNLMLLAMLKHLGINAHPVLLSTRGHGRPNSYYPILKQFNYVVVQVTVGGKTQLLDATKSFMPFGYTDFKCLNQKGWLMAGNAGKWIPIESGKFTKMTQIILKLDENGAAKGTISTYYGGYAAINQRNKINTQTEEEYLQDRIKKDIPNIEVDSIVFKNKKDVDEKLIEKIHFKIADFAEVGGDMIYVNPMLSEGYEENPFKLKERAYPIDLGYLISKKVIVNIYLPEGYVLDELPKPINMALGENGGVFRFIPGKIADGSIQIVNSLKLKKPIYAPSEYKFIKQFFDIIVEKQMLELVAKKAQP